MTTHAHNIHHTAPAPTDHLPDDLRAMMAELAGVPTDAAELVIGFMPFGTRSWLVGAGWITVSRDHEDRIPRISLTEYGIEGIRLAAEANQPELREDVGQLERRVEELLEPSSEPNFQIEATTS